MNGLWERCGVPSKKSVCLVVNWMGPSCLVTFSGRLVCFTLGSGVGCTLGGGRIGERRLGGVAWLSGIVFDLGLFCC